MASRSASRDRGAARQRVPGVVRGRGPGVARDRVPGARRGFTLVEALVAVAVFGLVMGLLYDVFVGGVRAFRTEEGRTESMESALLAWEEIAGDLRQHVFYGVAGDRLADVLPVSVGEHGALAGGTLSFDELTGVGFKPERPAVGTARVTYGLADSGHGDFKYLCRNGQARPAVRLAALRFTLRRATRADGRPMLFVQVGITGYGERNRDHSYLVGLVGLDPYNLRAVDPDWVEVRERLLGDQGAATAP